MSNNNSDTILLLETLNTRYLPFIPDSQYEASLHIEGLEVYLNRKNSEVEFNNLQDDIIDNLFFDNLSISKSKLFILNDTIQHKVDINNLNIFQIQKNTNGINFEISIF